MAHYKHEFPASKPVPAACPTNFIPTTNNICHQLIVKLDPDFPYFQNNNFKTFRILCFRKMYKTLITRNEFVCAKKNTREEKYKKSEK